ncbi:deoxyribose-phosphate aldolase [Hugenholtzia roseola]|uniref:deoxyribose-phosphate aldolase n=1 Tax=Hugenholtzia roseola TaxID=1002 RepID=UPI00041ABDCF|nr:deoxyribose-phosphate aldolase [Hugenholtzia roseola]
MQHQDFEKLAPFIEQTNLSPLFSEKDLENLIAEAKKYAFGGICLSPFWVKKAKRELQGLDTKLVTVVGFPLGFQRTEAKLKELEIALSDGADEIDMVMSLTAFKIPQPQWAKVEITRLAERAHQAEKILKVIVETAYLNREELSLAAQICMEAGADFIKTSTGFAQVGFQPQDCLQNPLGAKIEDVAFLNQIIKGKIGIKAAGGIKTAAQARAFLQAGAERIGTSSGVAICSAEVQ